MDSDLPTSIGRLGVTALDCPDALALADFYNSILGGDLVPGDDDDWVEVHTPTGRLAFQQIDDHRRPTWPGGDVPQQAHVDIDVVDLDGAEAAVLRLGAEQGATQPRPDLVPGDDRPGGPPVLPRPRPLTGSGQRLAPAKRVAVGGEALVVGEREHRWGHPSERAGVGPGDGGALEEGVGGDPGRHVGEARRRQRRRAADHEVRRAERGVLADQDLAGVDQPVDDLVDHRLGNGDLEVLGSELVGDPDRDVERLDQDTASVRAERCSSSGGAHVGETGELSFEFGVDGVGERTGVGEQHDGAVGSVLGLDQQVGGQQCRVGAVVGDHQALGRAEQHHRRSSVALHLDLRDRHCRRARPDDLANLRDRLGAEAERRDAGRAVHPEHVGDAELAAHDEHGRIDLARSPGDRRHHERDRRHAGDHRRHGQLVGDARIARLARRREQPRRGDRRDLLADRQAGLALERPVGGLLHLRLVEGTQMGDRIVDGGVDVVGHRCPVELVGAHPEPVRRHLDPVEPAERVAHRCVATVADVVDQLADRASERGVEDVVDPATHQRVASGDVHVVPDLSAHDAHRVDANGDAVTAHRASARRRVPPSTG